MKPFAVLGIGQFGTRVALALASERHGVLAIDHDEAVITRIKDRVSSAVVADITDEDAMREVGLEAVEAAVIATGEDQLVTILATAILRKIGVTRIVARAVSPIQARILRTIGANEVVFPEDEVGTQIARRLVAPGYAELLELESGRRLVEIGVLPRWEGRSLGQLQLRNEHRVHVIGIKRRVEEVDDTGETVVREKLNDFPAATDVLSSGDVLLLVGAAEDIEALRAQA